MEKEEFIQCIRENKGKMYAAAYSILKNHSDVEDVIQDAIINAYRKINTLKNDEKFSSWMMRIVINQSKMYIRKNSRLQFVESMEQEREQITEADDVNIWDLVMSLKSELSTVVILYYAQGYKVKEISEIMKIPEGTVKSRLAKAREILKKELEE